MNLYFDWIDTLLISVSFTGGLYFFGDSSWFIDYLPIFCLASYSLRRIIFKPAPLLPPKSGLFWRLCSIFGLLLTSTSIALFLLSWRSFTMSKMPTPDYRPKVLKLEQEIRESTKEINGLLNSIKVPANASQEYINNLQEKRVQQRAQQREMWISEQVQIQEQKHLRRKKQNYNNGLYLLLLSVLMCVLGSFLIRIRYPLSKNASLIK